MVINEDSSLNTRWQGVAANMSLVDQAVFRDLKKVGETVHQLSKKQAGTHDGQSCLEVWLEVRNIPGFNGLEGMPIL